MNEVKTPKRPLIYYALLALFLILLLNFMFVPMARKSSIEDVDYGTFMQMTEDHEIKEVEVEESKIYFVGTRSRDVDILDISAGWNRTGPKANHDRDPFTSIPRNMTATSNAMTNR